MENRTIADSRLEKGQLFGKKESFEYELHVFRRSNISSTINIRSKLFWSYA